VCFVSGVWDNIKPPFILKFNLFALINDIDYSVCNSESEHVIRLTKNDHMFMINTQHHFRHPINSDIGKALMTNEWIRGKVSFEMEAPNEDSHSLGGVIKCTGVSVNPEFSRMENVRFTEPFNYVSSSSDSQEPACIVDCSNDKGKISCIILLYLFVQFSFASISI